MPNKFLPTGRRQQRKTANIRGGGEFQRLPSVPCRDQILTVESEPAEATRRFDSEEDSFAKETTSKAQTASVWPSRRV